MPAFRSAAFSLSKTKNVDRLTSESSSSPSVISCVGAVFCKGTSAAGLAAYAPPAIDTNPAAPRTGTAFDRRFRFGACFVCDMISPPISSNKMFELMINQPTRPHCGMVSSEHPLGKADNSKIVVQRNIFANLLIHLRPASPFMSRSFSLTLGFYPRILTTHRFQLPTDTTARSARLFAAHYAGSGTPSRDGERPRREHLQRPLPPPRRMHQYPNCLNVPAFRPLPMPATQGP